MTTLARERQGGSLLPWIAIIALGFAVLAACIDDMPDGVGLFAMIGGGLLVGVSYAELISRLPNVTHRYGLSLALALVVVVVMVAVLVVNANGLPTPQQDPDAMLTPNISSSV